MYDTIVEPRAFTVFRPVLWMHWIAFVVIVLALILLNNSVAADRGASPAFAVLLDISTASSKWDKRQFHYCSWVQTQKLEVGQREVPQSAENTCASNGDCVDNLVPGRGRG